MLIPIKRRMINHHLIKETIVNTKTTVLVADPDQSFCDAQMHESKENMQMFVYFC